MFDNTNDYKINLMQFDIALMFLRIGYLASNGIGHVYSQQDEDLFDWVIYRHCNEYL